MSVMRLCICYIPSIFVKALRSLKIYRHQRTLDLARWQVWHVFQGLGYAIPSWAHTLPHTRTQPHSAPAEVFGVCGGSFLSEAGLSPLLSPPWLQFPFVLSNIMGVGMGQRMAARSAGFTVPALSTSNNSCGDNDGDVHFRSWGKWKIL